MDPVAELRHVQHEQQRDLDMLDMRMAMAEKTLTKIETATASIADSLQRIARVEERHADTKGDVDVLFGKTEKLEERVRNIETQLPTLNLVKGWVITGVLGIVALVGVAAYDIVFNKMHAPVAQEAAR